MRRGPAPELRAWTYRYWLNAAALDRRPARRLDVVACMDALRSLIVAVRLLGVRRILVINQTKCGMLAFPEAAFRRALRRATGRDPGAMAFHGFLRLVPHLREQVRRILTCPFIPHTVSVSGLLFDVRNGALREVA